jgi:hypothetical protein
MTHHVWEEGGIYRLELPESYLGTTYTYGRIMRRSPSDMMRGVVMVELLIDDNPPGDIWHLPRKVFSVEHLDRGYGLITPKYDERNDPHTFVGALHILALADHEARKARERSKAL